MRDEPHPAQSGVLRAGVEPPRVLLQQRRAVSLAGSNFQGGEGEEDPTTVELTITVVHTHAPQEANAIDCVMLFALRFLGFPESNVAIYGWSIGGFTATWIGEPTHLSCNEIFLNFLFLERSKTSNMRQ